jgi:hypothetical protein
MGLPLKARGETGLLDRVADLPRRWLIVRVDRVAGPSAPELIVPWIAWPARCAGQPCAVSTRWIAQLCPDVRSRPGAPTNPARSLRAGSRS